jgi:DNA-binding PadR family transcriptional regulator
MSRAWGWDWEGIFGFGGPRGWRPRRPRWFEAGDMKYVILKLLKDRPMHGYEIMKELEGRMRGCYAPSPGTVYPTLQYLEDEGLVKGREVEGKKIYEITDQGREFLTKHRDTVDEIFERVKETIDRFVGGSMPEINPAVAGVVRAAYRTAWKLSDKKDRQKELVEILQRATKEIDDLAAAVSA